MISALEHESALRQRAKSKWWTKGYTREWWLGVKEKDVPPSEWARPPLPQHERQKFLASLTNQEVEEFFRDWLVWARDNQLPPDWDWDTWLLKCGRGFGKTRTCVETINTWVGEGWCRRIAIVGQGEDDIRDVMIEGESGFLEASPSWNKPKFYPSKGGGALIWPNGCQGTIYSAADTEGLRGPQFHAGWFDEPMAVPRAQRERALDNLEFCLRLGIHPRLLLSTTPKPDPWMREQEKLSRNPENKIHLTEGSTHDNAENLAANFLRKIERKYGGTKKGKQEILGKTLGDEEGALWTEEVLEEHRLADRDPHEMADLCDKVVVAIDPNTKGFNDNPKSNKKKVAHAAGIVVLGKIGKKNFYVLADRTVGGGPTKWGKAAVLAALEFDADEFVAERNQGGDMVKSVLDQAMEKEDYFIGVHLPFSNRSKEGRAEPVATAYDRGDVHHVGPKAEMDNLEMQMMYLHEGEDPTGEDFDRCDALVSGLTRLGIKKRASSRKGAKGAGIRTFGDFGHGSADDRSSRRQPHDRSDSEL